MPADLVLASGGEPAKEPDFVVIDETVRPSGAIDARARPDDAKLAGSSGGRALRTVGSYALRRTLMRTMERTSTGAQILELKRTSKDSRLPEALRVYEAYRAIDKADNLQNEPQHRIDTIV